MWPALIPVVTGLLDKLLPDPQAAAEAKLRALDMAQKGELAALDADMRLALGQLEVNKAEATGGGYKSSWRPTCGWVCALGLAYTFLLRPLLPWFATVLGLDVPPLPAIETDTLMVLLTGMLGLGGLRTWEKARGVAG